MGTKNEYIQIFREAEAAFKVRLAKLELYVTQSDGVAPRTEIDRVGVEEAIRLTITEITMVKDLIYEHEVAIAALEAVGKHVGQG